MVNKVQFFDDNNLFNVYGLDLCCYYNPHTNTFSYEMQYELDDVDHDLIEAPYMENFKWLIRKKFREILNKEELQLVDSYTEKRGFFGFLREVGLIELYEQAEELVKGDIIEIWEKHYGLHIDYASVSVM